MRGKLVPVSQYANSQQANQVNSLQANSQQVNRKQANSQLVPINQLAPYSSNI